MNRIRRHRGYWASICHRISGLLLALFLPLHFLVLGLAIEGAERLDEFLRLADMPMVKLAESTLVMLLSAHMILGMRLLILELVPWAGLTATRTRWVDWGLGGSLVVGVVFLIGVL